MIEDLIRMKKIFDAHNISNEQRYVYITEKKLMDLISYVQSQIDKYHRRKHTKIRLEKKNLLQNIKPVHDGNY